LQSPDNLFECVRAIALAAKAAAPGLAGADLGTRNGALLAAADFLLRDLDKVLAANGEDLAQARSAGMSEAMLDRLRLDAPRVEGMAAALRSLVGLPDPLGGVDEMWTRPNQLRVGRRRIPLGVIGIIYEARPNVSSDAAGLCIKSGNAVILKGGREALQSNRAIVAVMQEGLRHVGLDPAAVSYVPYVEREAVAHLLTLEEAIDLVIPRGGEGLIRFVTEHATMPVIKHYKGVCHIYVHETAEVGMVTPIVLNAKVQRPSVCNAVETLLVDARWPVAHLRAVAEALWNAGVTLHVCAESHVVLGDHAQCVLATDEDWGREYLSLDLAVRIVRDQEAAVAHIRRYGSLHTEAILTSSYAAAERFLAEVDSSTVMVNASTRFADGGELGLGAEIGISTTKLHAFGPMGLRELTTTKFVVYGQGQVRV